MNSTDKRGFAGLRLTAAICWGAVVCGAAMLALGYLTPDDLRPAEGSLLALKYAAFLFRTFAYHAGLAMIGVAVFAILARRWRLLAGAMLVLAAGMGPTLLTLVPSGKGDGGRETLKIMSVNLMYGRGDVARLMEQIERESPDVLVFQEWTPGAAADLRERLAVHWPHAAEETRDDAFGQAVFSRREFVRPTRRYPPAKGVREPQITCEVMLAEKPIRITNVHLLPPMNREYFRVQRQMAGGLADWLEQREQAPDVLAGDFNAVSGSSVVRGICASGVREGQREGGWWRGSTWPRVGVLKYAPGIRLDHVLVGERVECVECRVGEDFGSDHAPVVARIAWREGSR